MRRRILTWVFVLYGSALGTMLLLLGAGYGLPSWWVVIGLALIAGIAERQSVAVTRTIETSVSFLPFVFTAVAFGPVAAMVVGALATVCDFRTPYLRSVVYIPARAVTGAIAGLAAVALLPQDSSTFGLIAIATSLAALANLAADSVFNTLTLVVRRSESPLAFVRTMGPLLLLSLPLYVPLVALLVYGYRAYSPWVVAAFLIPAVALQRIIHLYQEQREAVRDLAQANVRLERANLSFATALITTLDARDRYTAGHSAAVAIYSRDIAARMELALEMQQLVHVCGLVHDIGKVGLPPGMLEKPGPLTLEERRQMEEHSVIGARILAKVEDYAEIAAIVRHHHERIDGHGYPDGLAGADIPLLARVIAVADAYNAMTSGRPYREAMPSRVARLRLAQAVDSQFDTSVVAAFEAILAGADEPYRLASREDFRLEVQDDYSDAASLRDALSA